MNLCHVPEFLKPRLRIFLSIDLVGSTALKQGGSFSIVKPKEGDDIQSARARWFSDIASFYSEMEAKFARLWSAYCDFAEKRGLPIGDNPYLWKSNGDEIIYVKDLGGAMECLAIISCWMRAGKELREQFHTKGKKLDVKMSAWTAGFPISNSEVIFQSSYREGITENEDCVPEHIHYSLLEKWYSSPEQREGLTKDFIGPSIDTGFRISSRATPRKFMISLEIAFMISSFRSPDKLYEVSLYYDGRESLKGVLGDRPYPLFWIDTLCDDNVINLEDKVSGRKSLNRTDASEFCEEFLKKNSDFLVFPFIVGCQDHFLGSVPENYEELINFLANEWDSLKRHMESEGEGGGDVPEEESSNFNLVVDIPISSSSHD